MCLLKRYETSLFISSVILKLNMNTPPFSMSIFRTFLPCTDIPHNPHALPILHAKLVSKLEGHISRGNAFLKTHIHDNFGSGGISHLSLIMIMIVMTIMLMIMIILDQVVNSLVSVRIWTVSSPSSVMLNFSFLSKIVIKMIDSGWSY